MSKVKNIVKASLFSRFFAALLDVLIVIFVGAGIFVGASAIARNTKSVKAYKDDYITQVVDSGLMSYKESDDTFYPIEHESVEEYQSQLFDFYNIYYSNKMNDGINRDIYWFNVHIYGQEDVRSLYSNDKIENYFKTYGAQYFTYQLDGDGNKMLDSFALPKCYENDPSNANNISSEDKSNLLAFFFKSDSDRENMDSSDLWANFAIYFALSDLTNIQSINDDYSSYAFYSSTLPLVCTIIVTTLIFYLAIPLIFKNGETIGKLIMKVCLVNKLGYQYRRVQLIPRVLITIFFVALVTYLFGLSIISIGIITFVLLASYLCAVFSKNHVAFHDFFAGTIVVNKKESTWFLNAQEEEKAQAEVDAIQIENK